MYVYACACVQVYVFVHMYVCVNESTYLSVSLVGIFKQNTSLFAVDFLTLFYVKPSIQYLHYITQLVINDYPIRLKV